MKLHRFYIEENVSDGNITVNDKNLLNQWNNVLRFKVGDQLIAFNNTGFEFLCSIQNITKKEASLEILKKEKPDTNIKRGVSIMMALIKRENFELVLEKGTELGVGKFIPFVAERSVKTKLNLERCLKIIKEASEQSGKVLLPEIKEEKNLEGILKNIENAEEYVAFDPNGETFSVGKIKGDKINVFVGPEGGFTKEEIDLFKKYNVPVYSLGKQILRAETAAIALASILLLN